MWKEEDLPELYYAMLQEEGAVVEEDKPTSRRRKRRNVNMFEDRRMKMSRRQWEQQQRRLIAAQRKREKELLKEAKRRSREEARRKRRGESSPPKSSTPTKSVTKKSSQTYIPHHEYVGTLPSYEALFSHNPPRKVRKLDASINDPEYVKVEEKARKEAEKRATEEAMKKEAEKNKELTLEQVMAIQQQDMVVFPSKQEYLPYDRIELKKLPYYNQYGVREEAPDQSTYNQASRLTPQVINYPSIVPSKYQVPLSQQHEPTVICHRKAPLVCQSMVEAHTDGKIYSMNLSNSKELLATISTGGSIRVWRIVHEDKPNLVLHREYRHWDVSHRREAIDEFYCVHWSPDDSKLIVGGKRKDRYKWDEFDDDNNILKCPLYCFDLETGDVQTWIGHSEEVLCLRSVWYNGKFWYVSGGFDGCIFFWNVDPHTHELLHSFKMLDGLSNLVLTIEFLPYHRNRYFVAGCDNFVHLYDFETRKLLHRYQSTLVGVKYVKSLMIKYPQDESPFVYPPPPKEKAEDDSNDDTTSNDTMQDEDSTKEEDSTKDDDSTKDEMKDEPKSVTNETNFIPRSVYIYIHAARANSLEVVKLTFVDNSYTEHQFELDHYVGPQQKLLDELKGNKVKKTYELSHPIITSATNYLSRMAAYGHLLFVSNSVAGDVLIFNHETDTLVGRLLNHSAQVRDIVIHPVLPYVFTCGDDGQVAVYKNVSTKKAIQRAISKSNASSKSTSK